MKCPKCDEAHLDKLEWAERSHHNHLCEHCGTTFDYGVRSVGNPLAVCNPRLTSGGKLVIDPPPKHW